MNTELEYDVITDYQVSGFVRLLNQKVKEGWAPQGNMTTTKDRDKDIVYSILVCRRIRSEA